MGLVNDALSLPTTSLEDTIHVVSLDPNPNRESPKLSPDGEIDTSMIRS